MIFSVNNRKCHFTLSATRARTWGKVEWCALEKRIYASRNAINMQIIKQKSHVSAKPTLAVNVCIYKTIYQAIDFCFS